MPALRINLGLAGDQIRILGLSEGFVSLSVVHDVANAEHEDGKGQSEVASNEPSDLKGREDIESHEDEHNRDEEECPVSSVGREWGGVRKHVVGNALDLSSAEPSEVDNQHEGVRRNEGRRGKVNEPKEDLEGGVGCDEEGNASDKRHDSNAVDGNSVLGALEKELGSLAIWKRLV